MKFWVTPSRVCELKSAALHTVLYRWRSHPHGCVSWNLSQLFRWKRRDRHTLTGVWVEIWVWPPQGRAAGSHPHGCVSWNLEDYLVENFNRVTPSRVCELKWLNISEHSLVLMSHPHGCVSWNADNSRRKITIAGCHTLTGVWVEIPNCWFIQLRSQVTPSRVCELKLTTVLSSNIPQTVTPSRVCELKWQGIIFLYWFMIGHTLTGVWVEIRRCCRSFKHRAGHTLTGVWVEI